MINLSGITLKFGDKRIFNSYTLEIPEGSKIYLSGPSGKGKTSLFRILLGLERPQEGEVAVDGIILDSRSVKDIRKRIAYLSQDIDFRNVKVRELVSEIFSFEGNKDVEFSETAFVKKMRGLGLEKSILDEEVNSLSGGERQRVGLIICLMLERKILLLDEPTSALDQKMKEKVVQLIIESDKTVLVISHDKEWKEGMEVVEL